MKTVVFLEDVFEKVMELLEGEQEIAESTVGDEGESQEEREREYAKIRLDATTKALDRMNSAVDTE